VTTDVSAFPIIDVAAGTYRLVPEDVLRELLKNQAPDPSTILSPGKRLKLARKARGWTQEDLATFADLTQTTISNLERDKEHPQEDTLRALSSALGVVVTWEADTLAD